MLVIGEKINASIKSIAEAIANRNDEYLANLARDQANAGANFIDVNTGSGQGLHSDEIAAMKWLVDVVQNATDKPLAIDSDSPDMIETGLKQYRGEKVMINSVTAEIPRLEAVGPLAAERQASIIALAMGAEGIPDSVDKRLAACDVIMTKLTGFGIKPEDIYFDPLVLPIAVDARQGQVTLKTIEQIKQRFPDAKTVMGLSNVSYGLPVRKLINRTFLIMAAYAGLDAVIINPLDTKAMSFIKVADIITGKDPSCRAYLRAHRQGTIVE